MKKLNLSLSILTFVFIIVNVVSAQDIDPPAWRTNEAPGLTFQVWEFITPINPAGPDLVFNEYGTPDCDILNGEFTNNLPNPDGSGPPVSGWYFPVEENGIMLNIPNDPTPNPEKKIRMQITSTKSPSSENITGNPPLTTNYLTHSMSWQQSGPWYTYVYDFHLEPNPDSEMINVTFPAGTIVEEVVVDTWCLPEPSVLVALLSMLFFSQTRKK